MYRSSHGCVDDDNGPLRPILPSVPAQSDASAESRAIAGSTPSLSSWTRSLYTVLLASYTHPRGMYIPILMRDFVGRAVALSCYRFSADVHGRCPELWCLVARVTLQIMLCKSSVCLRAMTAHRAEAVHGRKWWPCRSTACLTGIVWDVVVGGRGRSPGTGSHCPTPAVVHGRPRSPTIVSHPVGRCIV